MALGLGNTILLRHEVQAIVDRLVMHLVTLMASNMVYIGITRFEEGGGGIQSRGGEVVCSGWKLHPFTRGARWKRSAAVQAPGWFGKVVTKLQALGFRVEVLYRNMLVLQRAVS